MFHFPSSSLSFSLFRVLISYPTSTGPLSHWSSYTGCRVAVPAPLYSQYIPIRPSPCTSRGNPLPRESHRRILLARRRYAAGPATALYSRLRIPVLAYNSGVLDVALCGQNGAYFYLIPFPFFSSFFQMCLRLPHPHPAARSDPPLCLSLHSRDGASQHRCAVGCQRPPSIVNVLQPYIRHRHPERYCDWVSWPSVQIVCANSRIIITQFAHHHIPRSGSRRKKYVRN
jgi:hypothetical protein